MKLLHRIESYLTNTLFFFQEVFSSSSMSKIPHAIETKAITMALKVKQFYTSFAMFFLCSLILQKSLESLWALFCKVWEMWCTYHNNTIPELGYSAGSDPSRKVQEVCSAENLRQGSWIKIRLNTFRRSPIPRKQLIFIIIKGICFKIYFSDLKHDNTHIQ